MGCNEGPDPADFAPGGIDPGDDITTPDPELYINDGTVINPTGDRKAKFIVEMTNEHVDDVTVRFDTRNGSASAGTHYTARINQTLTIPEGSTTGIIEVDILEPSGEDGQKNFFVDLSNPVNCTLVLPTGVILYSYAGSNPPPPDPDPDVNPINLTSHTGFTKPAPVYDQFAGCDYTYACTAAASGAAMSGLWQHAKNSNKSFDWKKLYRDAGGCLSCGSSCDGENWLTMLRRMRDHGIKELDGSTYYKATFTEISRSQTMNEIRNDIKRAVYNNGIVYLASPWYSNLSAGQPGWNRCYACNDFVLQNPNNDGPFGKNTSPRCTSLKNMPAAAFGHTWVITGWNNNKANGAFEIQHSAGPDWGADGRGWMPYSYMSNAGKWHYYTLVFRGAA